MVQVHSNVGFVSSAQGMRVCTHVQASIHPWDDVVQAHKASTAKRQFSKQCRSINYNIVSGVSRSSFGTLFYVVVPLYLILIMSAVPPKVDVVEIPYESLADPSCDLTAEIIKVNCPS